MKIRHLLLSLLALISVILSLPAGAAPVAAPAAPALVRFVLATTQYTDVLVEVDGRQVLQQPANRLGTYIPVVANANHTVAVYGAYFGVGAEGGPKLIANLPNFGRSSGSLTLIVATDNGATVVDDAAQPAPPDKALLRAVYIGDAPSASVRFGSLPLGTGPDQNRIVAPQTARVEVREPGTGKVAHSFALRAQRGYRYDVVVVSYKAAEGPIHRAYMAALSPQFGVQPTETARFKETGHLLEGRFRTYWEGTGGLPVFGFPLNDDHLEPTSEGAFVTQVFERNRFEYHPENKAPYDVLLGRLGDESLRRKGRDWRREYEQRTVGKDCDAVRTDVYTFAVCEPFRTYYRTHGLELDGRPGFSPQESLALFGLPLTQARPETNSSGDTVLTQYFERARFESHPRNGQSEVLLGRLGAEVYDLQPFTFDDEDRNFVRSSTTDDWQEAQGGFGGHFWWTCAEYENFVAGWQDLAPPTSSDGLDVEVFVPDSHANSRKARYQYWHGGDTGEGSEFNQKPWSNQWTKLHHLHALAELMVQSGTGEGGSCTYMIAVDAIRLVPRGKPVMSVKGTVLEVVNGPRPLVKLNEGAPVRTIAVRSDRIYWTHGESATLADVKPGLHVFAYGPVGADGVLEADNFVLGLMVEGKVQQVQTTGNRTLVTLAAPDDDGYGYVGINPNTKLEFAVNGNAATLGDIKAGTRLIAYGTALHGGTVEARRVSILP